ncbi:MAG TPA: hypothetical protein VJ656_10095 [Pyrinomonadaceae bacterium]|nr:hypothetical protein [Pyrinomonadaceae bacterium]
MRLALIIAITISILAPQQREAPSVVGAQRFVSTFGKFSIALPNPTRFGPLTIPTPLGNARGHLFHWETKEATFGVGYGDAAQPLDGPVATKQFFDGATDRFNKVASANSGNVGAVKPLTLDKHPGIEQRVDLFTGSVIQRTYIVSRRVYEIVAVMKNNQKTYESVALGVLDSFKVLSDAEVKAKEAEELAKAEPSPLPQTPVAQRAGSDARDTGLHGHVKSVLTETQTLSAIGSRPRKRNSVDTYNEQGNLVRSEFYDDNGNVSAIKVYGYLDGSRVSTVADVEREYNPPPLTTTTALPPGSKKSDPRFQYRSEFKYDEKKRLTEESTFLNNGKLWMRTVYKYNANQKEQLDYSDDGSLGQRVVYTLDDKGNVAQQTVFNETGEARYKTSYTYEFDSNGNWTKQTATRVEVTEGGELPLPTTVCFRTITYF